MGARAEGFGFILHGVELKGGSLRIRDVVRRVWGFSVWVLV